MRPKVLVLVAVACCGIFLASPAAPVQQILSGHVPAAVTRLHLLPLSRYAGTNQLTLAIGLPLRNQEALTNLLQQLYDPASTNYHHYLTPEQFAEQFGPRAEDYQAVIAFAKASGFKITGTHPNRTLLDVQASVADIEKALHVRMNQYRHPTESRNFFAPDTEPVLNLAVPVLHIAGLDNFQIPHPLSHIKPLNLGAGTSQLTGSGSDGTYIGNDFRAAYAPGVTLTGAGQSIGILQFSEGFYQSDINAYEAMAGLPNVPVKTILIDGFDGSPGYYNNEAAMDIELVISMAPGLDQVLVYEGKITDDILNQMATDNSAKQLSASWLYSIDPSTAQILQQFAAQGQSFFNAAGDYDAYVEAVDSPADNPAMTIVGGTELATTGPGGAWSSESVWNWGGGSGSGGGISTTYLIPYWQTNVNMTANGGSTSLRNLPDVAAVADDIFIIYGNGVLSGSGGTSSATPLWAGFMALVNEQAAAGGKPAMGFLNPALYAIGLGPAYDSCFHDIISGSNTWAQSPAKFFAVPGYDLCSGWGTPGGAGLIAALAQPDPLQIFPTAGFEFVGATGDSFTNVFQTLTLTNAGKNSAGWTLSNPVLWLTTSVTGGTIGAGASTLATVSLSPSASNLALPPELIRR